MTDRNITVEIVRSQYGDALYVEGHRVAGVKPIGGGKIVREWKVSLSKLWAALGIPKEGANHD